MKQIHLIFSMCFFAAYLCAGCGDKSATSGDESDQIHSSHQSDSSQSSQSGWIILSASSSLKREREQRDSDPAFLYTPAFTNTPYSYSAPGLLSFNRLATSNATLGFYYGGTVGGALGGVFAPFPGYGGAPAGGALPGASISAGTNLGAVTGVTALPQPTNRVLRPQWFPWGRGYGYYGYGPYLAVPVFINGGIRNPTFQPRALSTGEPHPVILYAPVSGGFYQPIVTFRGTT